MCYQCSLLTAATELWGRRAVRHYAEQHAMELDREPSVHTLAKLVAQVRCESNNLLTPLQGTQLAAASLTTPVARLWTIRTPSWLLTPPLKVLVLVTGSQLSATGAHTAHTRCR